MDLAAVAEQARRSAAQHAHKATCLLRAAARGEPLDPRVERELSELESAVRTLRRHRVGASGGAARRLSTGKCQ